MQPTYFRVIRGRIIIFEQHYHRRAIALEVADDLADAGHIVHFVHKWQPVAATDRHDKPLSDKRPRQKSSKQWRKRTQKKRPAASP